ncbi:hypothetical protein LTR66_015777, partial [Elasticomyces elasticus]
ERKAELEAHVKAVNAVIHPQADLVDEAKEDMEVAEDEWNGLGGSVGEVEPIDHEAEYIDEDKYTTVTVEEVDVSKDGLAKLRDESDKEEEEQQQQQQDGEGAEEDDKPTSRNEQKKKKPSADSSKKSRIRRKREFRYESKEDRKMNRAKEKMRKSKQAKARREAK